MERSYEKKYKENFATNLLRYGETLRDHEENIWGHFVRQRILCHNNTLYVHTMIDGKFVLCEQIEEEKQ